MSIKTYDPPRGPSYDLQEVHNREVAAYSSIKGWEQTRPLGPSDRRTYQFQVAALNQDDLDYSISFFQSLKDDAGDYSRTAPFYWTPIRSVPTPSGDSPKLEEVSGGSLGIRTYYVGYTWYNNDLSQETKMCPSGVINLSANYLCKVTLPIFPSGATRARIYATSGAQGTEKLEAAPTTRTWTEPVTGLIGTGISPPTANNLKPPIKFVLVGGIATPQFTAGRWRLGPLVFEEQWI